MDVNVVHPPQLGIVALAMSVEESWSLAGASLTVVRVVMVRAGVDPLPAASVVVDGALDVLTLGRA